MKLDTPETDAACNTVYTQGVAHIPLVGFMEKLERERNEWKANHDKMVEEKQQAELLNISFHMRIRKLESAIRNLRNLKGTRHSGMAYNKLLGMLPESKGTEL